MLDPDFDEEKILSEINQLKQNTLHTMKKSKKTQDRKKKVSFSELAELEEDIAKDNILVDQAPENNEKTTKTDAEIYTQRELLDLLEETDDDLKKKSVGKPNKKEETQIFNTKSEQYTILDEVEMKKLKKTVRLPCVPVPKLTASEIERLTSSPEYLRFYLATMQSKSIQKKHVQFGDMSKYLPSRYEDVDNDGIYDYDDDDDDAMKLIDDENSLLTFAAKKPKIVKDEIDLDKENVEKTVAGINRLFTSSKKESKKRGRPRKNPYSRTVMSVRKKSVDIEDIDNIVKAELNGDDDDFDYVPGQEVDWTRRRTPSKVFYSCR